MDISLQDQLRRRREEILFRMDTALSKSGRTLADVELIAVSKTVDVEYVQAAIAVGYERLVRTARRSSPVRSTAWSRCALPARISRACAAT